MASSADSKERKERRIWYDESIHHRETYPEEIPGARLPETHGVCSDLISRQDAIDAVAKEVIGSCEEEDAYYNSALRKAIKNIRAIPSLV